MSDEAIKPALTPEEWAPPEKDGWEATGPRCLDDAGDFWIEGGEVWRRSEGLEELVRNRHGLAALCLCGQPFGFTREDVEAIEAEAQGLLRAALWCPEGYSVDNPIDAMSNAEFRAKAARLQSLASRIAALLPPEDAK